jgi:hypothetical protein
MSVSEFKELYNFINECAQFDIYVKDNGQVQSFLFIEHYRIEKFCKILGMYEFDDGGFGDVHLGDSYIVAEITDILGGRGGIKSYMDCFSNLSDLSSYNLEILKKDYRFNE